MKPDILVPLFFFVTVAALTAYALRLHAQTRRLSLDIIREALEKGVPLDRDTVEAIADGYRSRFADLRRGAFFVAIGGALLLLSIALDGTSARVARGLASFPGLIGLTYFGLYFGRWR